MSIAREVSSFDARRHLQIEDAWSEFVAAVGTQRFLHAWVTILCLKEPLVRAAVVLMRSTEENFSPVALWPEGPRDLSFFGKVCEQAIASKAGAIEEPALPERPHFRAAIPLQAADDVRCLIAIEVAAASEAATQQILRNVQWAIGWLQAFVNQQLTDDCEQRLSTLGSVVENIALSLQQAPLRQTLIDLVNGATRELHASRVSIGLVKRGAIRIEAISDSAQVVQKSELVSACTAAMHETMEMAEPICIHASDSQAPAGHATPAHTNLLQQTRASSIVSLPLLANSRCVGVILAERHVGDPFAEHDIKWMQALVELLTPILELKQTSERGLLKHFCAVVNTIAARLFKPGHLVWKYAACTAVLLVAALWLIPFQYKVGARTVIEGEVQRVAAAPFDGFIASSEVRAGDVVQKDQQLCALDDRDVRLERDKWLSEREQHSRELRQAMAEHDLPKVQIYEAQIQQSEANYKQAEEQLRKASVRAPFDGVVVSGDLSQLIGSPVERGKKLFEIAPLQSYRVILEVDETELRYVTASQSGILLISGLASERMSFHVSKVMPVATAKDGKNFFRVEARLDHPPMSLRPGMEGVGKIYIGQRSLWWILTHSAFEWLELWFWRWLP